VWLKDGKVFRQGASIDRLPLLLDLGALDRFDRLLSGAVSWVFLTEDRNTRFLQILVEQAGFNVNETLIVSYKTSSNLEAAKLLAGFVKEVAANTRIVIHRDRDFMTDAEVEKVAAGIVQSGAVAFLTEESDLECYFIRPAHLGQHLGVPADQVEQWLSEVAQTNHMSLQHAFTRKRDEIKRQMYREHPDQCPETLGLLGDVMPLPKDKRHGKAMLKLIRANIQAKFGQTPNLLLPTPHLGSWRLEQIRVQP
jgi:hypothetical protein